MYRKLLSKLMLLLAILFVGVSTSLAENVNVLSENFDSGSASGWTLSGKTSYQGSSGAKSLQLASSKGEGSATTPAFSTLVGSTATLTFSIESSGSSVNTLTITGNNCKVNGEASTTALTSAETVTVAITEASTTSTITFSAVKNGGCRIDNVVVYYTTSGGDTPSLTASDFTLTNSPISLSFDLYNNSTSQTISYSTSSTGSVSIENNSYATFNIDETNKTITVNPTTVTPSEQTITINQAADATYDAGSATFTLTVTDSTPFSGGDVTFIAGTDVGSTSTNNSADQVSKSGVTISSTDAAFATAQYRLYKDSETEISTTTGTITKIVFTKNGSYNLADLSTTTGSYDSSTGTWTGNASSVSFSAAAQVRLDKIVVTVDVNGTPTPEISADDVSLAYDDENGSISYTLTNEVTGGTVSAELTSGNWLTLGNGTASPISFTCSANSETTARTATVTLTYTYNTNETVTKVVTVTQAAAPVVYTTIPALFEAATSTAAEVNVTFNNWVVSGVSTNGKNVFVTDNAGNGFVIYSSSDQSSTYSVGSILSGNAVSCSLKLNSGYAQLTNLDASDLTITTGGTVSTSNIAMASLAGVNTGALVSYEGLTCSVSGTTYTLTDGTTTIQLYTSLYNYTTTPDLEDGKTYNITGIYQQYSNTKEILPRSAADIVEVVVPTITVTPATATPSSSDVEGTLAISYQNLTISDMNDFAVQFYDGEGNELASGSEPTWIEVLVAEEQGGGYVVSYTMGENTGEARTAYFKICALDANSDLVYSNLVTVTQVAPVVDYATLPFSFNGTDITNTNGLTGEGLGAYTSANQLKFDGSGDYLILKTNEAPGMIRFEIKANPSTGTTSTGSFKVQVSEDGANFNTDLASYTSVINTLNTVTLYNTNTSVRYIRWIFETKESGNIALGNILVRKGCPKEVGTNGWATWIAPTNVTVPSGVKAYYVTNTTETSASLTELETIPANEPVLLKNEGSYEFVPAASADAVSGNLLSVSDGTIANGKVAYVLAKNGDSACFKKWTGDAATLNGRVVMIVDAAAARSIFMLDEDGTTTGVANVNANINLNDNWYDLQGRRVAAPQKGLYIVNGKKVVIK